MDETNLMVAIKGERITRAKAEAQRLQRATISPIILQLRAIEKWDGHFPQVIADAMPFIDVGTLSPRK